MVEGCVVAVPILRIVRIGGLGGGGVVGVTWEGSLLGWHQGGDLELQGM